MMLNRSKVHSAKLKISELKQKYSTDTDLGKNERDSELIEHENMDSSSNIKGVLISAVHASHNRISPDSSNQKTSIEHSFNKEKRVLTQRLVDGTIETSSLETDQNFGLLQIKSHDIISKYGSIVSSRVSSPRDSELTMSDEVSHVVNQLDNLCFISSSSDEQIKTITEYSTPREQHIFIQTPKDVATEFKMLTNKRNSTIEANIENGERNALLEQLKHLEIDSSKTNEEIGSSPSSPFKSMSENGSLEYPYSNTLTYARSDKSFRNNKSSYLESSHDKVNELSTGSKKRIQRISNSHKREQIYNGVITDRTRLKRCNSLLHYNRDTSLSCDDNKGSNNDRNNRSTHKLEREFSSKYNERDEKNLTCIQSNDRKGNFHGTRKYKADGNIQQLFLYLSTKLEINMGFNQNTKRPVLRSTRLIKNTEQTQGRLCNPEKQATIITKNTKQLHHPITPSPGHEECEQIINNLLLNQIQMTRHFIDSHHNMYLLCCQAAQKLSDDYASGNGFPDKNTTK